ncbi:hypothetical protein [Marinoscillum furvescens]|uniref:Outer membrane beta-barrel porin/alpha-amylase n=1 Tax=Marinoscillum furvescens DSM 4134 TaxID=1122208 RepID=A0A3D9L170_MARFU|nr:hypothetical protein [Marinoscillum furvescens]RED97483.1 hypothetical protein C7460_11293 [Marinoscillum furvescens DSM 4134]
MRNLIIASCLVFFTYHASAQGCSDAGFCTMGAMKPDQSYSKQIDFKLRTLELNYYRGRSLLSPVITAITADMTFGINDLTAIQLKVPYQMVSGNLGETSGIADLSISATRSFPIERGAVGVTLGGKLPTGKANIEKEPSELGPGGDYPMYYQTSLGTYDIVLGTSYINENWLFATGIQLPIVHQNENDFRWGHWPGYPSPDYINSHDLANNLRRGTDIMLRAERNFRYVNYNFGIGALGIYRISKDEVYNFRTDTREKLDGTTGLAFTMLANFGYHINVNHSLKLIYAHKVTDREVNPDGLTRHDVLSTSYIYRF